MWEANEVCPNRKNTFPTTRTKALHAFSSRTISSMAIVLSILSRQEKVARFLQGYQNAKKEGENVGLDVFFGWEARLGNDEFLIYALDGS